MVAVVSSGGTFLTALSALLLVYRGFNSLERRLELIESDLKQFFKDLTRHESDITTLKDRQK